MADITMPRLSDTMSEGAVGRWLKKPGDKVQKDEVIAEIETDKATMDLVSFEDGTLQEIVVPEGKVVPIGEVIGIIGNGPAKAAPKKDAKGAAKDAKAADAKADAKTADAKGAEAPKEAAAKDAGAAAVKANGSAGAPTSAPAPAKAESAGSESESEDAGPQLVARDGERVKASPVARRVAEEHGLDIRTVPGTGPGGRILRANVEEFAKKGGAPAAAKPAAPAVQPKGEVTPLSRIRKAVARAMSESKPGVPHIYLTVEIDMGPAMALRKQINESGAAGVNISPNDLIIKAVARALTKHPWLNASYATTPDGQPGMITHPQINVSVAVATDNGLLAPVVKDADKKGLGQIATEVKDLATRARDGGLKQNDLEGATFQTSNLGMFGVVEFVSIVTTPQCASLAIGAIRQVPVVKDGAVTIGERLNVTLSVDHRVADGAAAAQYLQDLTKLLQAPLSLLI
jgi:pyruvate dehydrogenase E2 component (dihydrolipoamide acetyltransferase)